MHIAAVVLCVCSTYMPVCIVLFLMCMVMESWQVIMPWDKWSWSMPQEPIEYYFRRHEYLPVKTPSFRCDCPPQNECVLDFKVNHDMADFLNLRGVIKKEEITSFKEELKRQELVHKDNDKNGRRMKASRNRRSYAGDSEENCCCPPRSVYMPTFITENKFNDIANKFKQEAK